MPTHVVCRTTDSRLWVPSATVGTGATGTYFNGTHYVNVSETTAPSWLLLPGTTTTATSSTSIITHSWSYSTYGTYYTAYDPPSEAELERIRRERLRRERTNVYKAKAAIKKALKLMDNVGFGGDVRIFLGGDELEVSHPDSIFKFVLKRGEHSVIQRTHAPGYSTPYVLELYTKDDVYVSRLCVYVQDTPMLDQVLAISMFIKTGDEEHILRKANYFNLTQDMHLRETLSQHLPFMRTKLLR